MKKEVKKSKEFSKDREFAVILEKLYTEIKIISESQSTIRDKLDRTMGMVAKNSEDITMLNIKTVAIKDEITKINGKLANIENRLTGVEEDLRIIKTDFSKRISHLEAIKS